MNLERIAAALDGLPALTVTERALIFAAMEKHTAHNRPAWAAVKHIDLLGGEMLRPFTLAEAVRWEQWPAPESILAALEYASGFVLTASEKKEGHL